MKIKQKKIRVLPPVPPKPPKRGILKGPRNSPGARDSPGSQNRQSNSHNSSTENAAELIKNTLQNELITYENVSSNPDNHNTEEVRLENSIKKLASFPIQSSP